MPGDMIGEVIGAVLEVAGEAVGGVAEVVLDVVEAIIDTKSTASQSTETAQKTSCNFNAEAPSSTGNVEPKEESTPPEEQETADTLFVNLVGGPCSGKSTIAAGIFHKLKLKQEISTELLTEAVKDFVYDKNQEALNDQLLITATQNHKMKRLKGEVQLVVCDAALFNANVYNQFYNVPESILDKIALELFHSYRNMTFLLPRKPKYDQYGRSQSEDEARKLDELFVKFMKENRIPFVDLRIYSHEEIPDIIIEMTQNRL